MKKDDRDRATLLTVVFMAFAMSGKPGRYMSMVNGTIAVRSPKSNIVTNLLFLFMPVFLELPLNSLYKQC